MASRFKSGRIAKTAGSGLIGMVSKEGRDEMTEQKKDVKEVPAEIEGDAHTWWYVCGECHGAIDHGEHKCRHCRNIVLWDKGNKLERG